MAKAKKRIAHSCALVARLDPQPVTARVAWYTSPTKSDATVTIHQGPAR
jgi:hypothetical protein